MGKKSIYHAIKGNAFMQDFKIWLILITSRGTSTLGWCLSTQKPVIFINYNNHFQVTKEFTEDAKQSIFCFELYSK